MNYLRFFVKIEITKSFLKDIKKLPKEAQSQIEFILIDIKEAQTLHDIKNIKKLQNNSIFYRIRVGNYRLGFAYENDTIILIHFLHRKEIYRFFP
jgi:mRNA interferase RelE/StbE